MLYLIIFYGYILFIVFKLRTNYKEYVLLKRDKKFIYIFLSILFTMSCINLSSIIYHDIQKKEVYSEIIRIEKLNKPINKQLI